MKNINENWLKKELENIVTIEELKQIKKEILNCSDAYMNVFNGAPFYEDWNLKSSEKVILDYIKNRNIILCSKDSEKIIGFLVSTNTIPIEIQKYFEIDNQLKYIDEIGVLSKYRNKGLASEMVRILIQKYLNYDDKYICYRTNAMRYFKIKKGENFEDMVTKIQKEDKISRIEGKKIVIPNMEIEEKQDFINQYIELISKRPDLDVSNSNALFRSIFGIINYSKIGSNYSFQKDPTGEGNDRIFPIINLVKKV